MCRALSPSPVRINCVSVNAIKGLNASYQMHGAMLFHYYVVHIGLKLHFFSPGLVYHGSHMIKDISFGCDCPQTDRNRFTEIQKQCTEEQTPLWFISLPKLPQYNFHYLATAAVSNAAMRRKMEWGHYNYETLLLRAAQRFAVLLRYTPHCTH